MRVLSIIGFTVLFAALHRAESIYTHTVPKIEGSSQPLSAYEGKMILIVTLPLQQSASSDSVLYSLDMLDSANFTNLAVLAVPPYKDGYTLTSKIQDILS